MFNKAILIGRLTADPELKTTPNGVPVVSFTVACDRRFSRDSERKADFINVVAWRQSAEFVAKYFSKGKAIGVEGSIQTRDYTDKNNNKRYVVEVVADNVFFVESKGSSGGAAPAFGAMGGATQAPVAYSNGDPGDFEEIETDSDLPF